MDHNDKRIELVRKLIGTIEGENIEREGVLDTPKRVAKMYDEIFSGYGKDPADVMNSVFDSDNDQMVVVSDIDYFSHCEHHMVPFYGKVHIGYIPKGKVLGLSKFARLTEIFARRLQIQENMTTQIADAIQKHLDPAGLIVVITGHHLCMSMRGVKKANSVTVTSAVRGIFKEDDKNAKQEFLELLKLSQ